MANPQWPATLPRPLADESAQWAPAAENVIATSMETGAPKYRRRFTSVLETFTGTLKLTGAQWATLQTFYDVTLGCVMPFDWVDFRSNAAATYTFIRRPKPSFVQGMADQWLVTIELLKAA